jgi:hypothetical protein
MFYRILLHNGLDVLPDENVFSLIHLVGIIGSTIDRYVQPVSTGTGTTLEAARGSLQIVIDYLDHLKKAGADDDTLLVVVADHGSTQHYQRPLLLVRDPGYDTQFKVSSDPITFMNLMPMLEAYLMGESSTIDFLYNTALAQETRMFYYFDINEMWLLGAQGYTLPYLPDISEHLFFNSSTDFLDAHFTGVTHRGENLPLIEKSTYQLGDIIDFRYLETLDDIPQRFFVRGLLAVSSPDINATHIRGNDALFRARLSERVYSDLKLDMSFLVYGYGEGQTVRLYSGGQFVDEIFFYNIGGDVFQDATFIIPRESIERGINIELRFEFPDAVRPMDVFEDNEDPNLYSIAFEEMTISGTAYNVIHPVREDEATYQNDDNELNVNNNAPGTTGVYFIMGFAVLTVLVLPLLVARIKQK